MPNETVCSTTCTTRFADNNMEWLDGCNGRTCSSTPCLTGCAMLPPADETVKDSEEWMPDEIKMCQFNGLLIMVDLYNTCWSDAFYSLINLAHFAKTGRNVQQGTVVSGRTSQAWRWGGALCCTLRLNGHDSIQPRLETLWVTRCDLGVHHRVCLQRCCTTCGCTSTMHIEKVVHAPPCM